MNYRSFILNKLLDKYEKSKSLVKESNRKIVLNLSKLKEYDIEDYEAKELFHDVVFELEKKGLILYNWKKHEKGNILEEVMLNKDNVDKVYIEANRIGIKNTSQNQIKILENIEFRQEWIECYRKDMINYLKTKYKPNSLFPVQFDEDILKVLEVIDKQQENLKRVLSIKCFGDSKYFEKNIEHTIIRIIKKYLLDESQEEYTNDDILLEVGISKYPEIIEFDGDLEFYIRNEKIKYNKITKGSYINSYNVKEMENLKLKNIDKIVFIENKANYIDYIQNKRKGNELIIYHGGMYSPTKGEFFKKIYKAGKDKEIYHWSDIDIGGFKIFSRLREIIPTLKPYKMDKESFYSRQKYWKEMNPDYIEKLEKMKNEAKYEIFKETINEMLKNKSKLEQEAFI